MSSRLLRVCVLTVALATVAVGCGSSKSSSSSTSSAAAASSTSATSTSSGGTATPSISLSSAHQQLQRHEGPEAACRKPGKGKVAVILPDTTTSTRYVQFDAPDLAKAFTTAGLSRVRLQHPERSGQRADPNHRRSGGHHQRRQA